MHSLVNIKKIIIYVFKKIYNEHNKNFNYIFYTLSSFVYYIFLFLLFSRGHNITFLNGFPSDFHINGLHEVTPAGLVEYIQNYTNWDLLGARMSGEMPISIWDGVRYAFEVSE